MGSTTIHALVLVIVALAFAPSVVRGSWQSELEAYIQSAMACPNFPIPALSISIVKHGKIEYVKGFGTKDISGSFPVDGDTLFGIGSCTKAFTSAGMAVLADHGIVDLDEVVSLQHVLPQFRMMDDSISLKVTPRDMMSHRTGLAKHDLAWVNAPKTMTREDLVYGLQYLAPNLPFRYAFNYNNHMYSAVGYLSGKLASASSWEEFISDTLLRPLWMNSTTPYVAQATSSGNYALAYTMNGGKLMAFDPAIDTLTQLIAPAGAISSSAMDMAKWMSFQLNATRVPSGRQILSPAGLSVTHEPSMCMRTYSILTTPTFPVSCTLGVYALGWWRGSYRENEFIFHSGNSFGFTAMVMLYPKLDVGIFVVVNNDLIRQRLWLAIWMATDLFLGYEPWLNGTTVCTYPCPFNCSTEEHPLDNNVVFSRTPVRGHGRRVSFESKPMETTYSVKLIDYVGQYGHPAYGTVTISLCSDSSLQLRWNDRVTGNLTLIIPPVPDIFTAQMTAIFFTTPTPFELHFYRNNAGQVDSVAIPLEPSVPAILFTNSHYQQMQWGYVAYPVQQNITEIVIENSKTPSSTDSLLTAVVVLGVAVLGLSALQGLVVISYLVILWRKRASSDYAQLGVQMQ